MINIYQIMPNHVHAIILLGESFGAGPSSQGQPRGVAPTLAVPDVIHRFKVMTTKRYMDGVEKTNWIPFNKKLWQRNYYEHVIRNEGDHERINEYIINNPLNWSEDENNPGKLI